MTNECDTVMKIVMIMILMMFGSGCITRESVQIQDPSVSYTPETVFLSEENSEIVTGQSEYENELIVNIDQSEYGWEHDETPEIYRPKPNTEIKNMTWEEYYKNSDEKRAALQKTKSRNDTNQGYSNPSSNTYRSYTPCNYTYESKNTKRGHGYSVLKCNGRTVNRSTWSTDRKGNFNYESRDY